MKYFFLVMVVAIAAIVVMVWDLRKPFIGTSGSVEDQKPDGPIIAFGDSLVTGFGIAEGNDWVSLVSQRIEQPIINAGVNGDTSAAALKRLDTDALQYNPRIVIVVLGGNDILQRVPVAETEQNLRALIEKVTDQGSLVVLAQVKAPFGIASNYGQIYNQLAEMEGVLLAPDVLRGILGNDQLTLDPIHPSEAGALLLADRIEPVLRKALNQ